MTKYSTSVSAITRHSKAYVVCPKSGLSYTVIADWAAAKLSCAIHPDARDYGLMARTIRGNLHNIPNSYIAAYCQVWARDNELLVSNGLEGKSWLAGYITEALANLPRNRLIALFWICYNSAAGGLRTPITINISDSSHTPIALYALFVSVATQSTDELRWKQATATYQLHRTSPKKAKSDKLDIQSSTKRVARLLPRLANSLPETPIAIASARKAAKLLANYATLRPLAKARVIEIMDSLFVDAKREEIYHMDSLQYKSYEVVKRALIAETPAPVMQEVEF
jgi:hypothetical protein